MWYLSFFIVAVDRPLSFRYAHPYHLMLPCNTHRHCIQTAIYLREQLSRAGICCRLNDLSSTVVLERPIDDAFVKRWQLACEEDIAHVVVMPNVTRQKIKLFIKELVNSISEHGRIKPKHPNSLLTQLDSNAWCAIR